MTDPGWADRTYLEPLDVAGRAARCSSGSGPDALLPTLGGQTALNLASLLSEDGHAGGARDRADRRVLRGHPLRRGPRAVRARPWQRIGLRVPRSAIAHSLQEARAALAAGPLAPAGRDPAGVHAGRPGRRVRRRPRGVRGDRRPRAAREPDRPGADRGVGGRLGRVRARGDPRPQRQRRRHLLDRERRPDGRAHRRLGDRRAGADPVRPRVPGAARRRGGRDPRGRRRDRRLERPVRAEPRDRRAGRDRDEPARVAVVGAGLEGHRLPDRQGGDQAGRSATRWTRSPTTSPAPRRRRSSRRWTTW